MVVATPFVVVSFLFLLFVLIRWIIRVVSKQRIVVGVVVDDVKFFPLWNDAHCWQTLPLRLEGHIGWVQVPGLSLFFGLSILGFW
jgi:hypothetical protein